MATKTTKKTVKTTKPAKKTTVKSTTKTAPKATSKTAPKATSKTTAKVSTPVVKKEVATATPEKAKRSFKLRKSYVILVLVILALAALLYFFRSVFVAAVVNGQPITRLEVVKETEKQSGKQALANIVRNTLIEQEARKQNVTVSEKEIDDELKKVEGELSKQGQKLDQVLELQGMTKADLRELIRLDKLVGKMVGKDIEISDKEVADYIEKNKESLPEDQSEDELKKAVKERLKQQELNEKVRTWLEDLQKKANIVEFVQY